MFEQSNFVRFSIFSQAQPGHVLTMFLDFGQIECSYKRGSNKKTCIVMIHMRLPYKKLFLLQILLIFRMIKVGNVKYRCAEGLFNPALFGKDVTPLQNMIERAIKACDIDQRRILCKNIYLSGGTSMLPGM